MTLQENLQQQTLKRYIKNISIMNTQTANEYYVRLLNFERFLISNYGSDVTIDKFIDGLKKGKFNVYDALGDYCVYLQNSQIYTTTLKQRVVTTKNFLEFNDIDISP